MSSQLISFFFKNARKPTVMSNITEVKGYVYDLYIQVVTDGLKETVSYKNEEDLRKDLDTIGEKLCSIKSDNLEQRVRDLEAQVKLLMRLVA